jgi:hypothetical protein
MENAPRWKLIVIATLALASSTTGFVSKSHSSRRPAHRSLCASAVPVTALQDMTVKELRQLLKDSDLQERGLLSKLKLKEDLVKYLEEHLSEEQPIPTTARPTNPDPPLQKSRIRVAMPPLAPNEVPSSADSPPRQQDPFAGRDAFFETIYDIYPALRDGNCTRLGEEDVRQQYHPMLQNSATSDMDLICVGTASCTPGLTRGVSCTALRLNWRRRFHPSTGEKVPEYTSFTGGTWMFDVGECTQVSYEIGGDASLRNCK